MKLQISTDAVGSRDRVPFWIDQVCAHLVEVQCSKVSDAEHFHGSVTKVAMPELEVAQIAASAQVVQRTAALARAGDCETLLVNIQRRGYGRVSQDGRLATLAPGDFAIYTSSRPYELSFDGDFEQTVLMLPAASVMDVHHDIGRLSAIKVPSHHEATQVMTALADLAYRAEGRLPVELTAALTDAIRKALQVSLSHLQPTTPPSGNLERYHLVRVRAFVSANLGDTALSARMIAQGIGLSVSHVHRLFRHEPQTLMEFVWEQRLAASHRALASGCEPPLSIGEIAWRNGFSDLSHFSKSYRRKFGISPSDSRAGASRRKGYPA
jgi:AraC-like DNA-binding protein